MRQFTGKPLASVNYDRHSDHGLLPKAPITLRHELSVPTRIYTFGPAPIENHRSRSDMESFATPEEVLVQAKKHFGPGNIAAIMAAEHADLAARGTWSSTGGTGTPAGDPRSVQNMEETFAKKWRASEIERGVVFGLVHEDEVKEPNRQLKMPVPAHRVINMTAEEKLNVPLRNRSGLVGDYVAGGAASLLSGNRTSPTAATSR